MLFPRQICHRLKYILSASSCRATQKSFHSTPTFSSIFNSSLYFSSSEDVYSVLQPAFDRSYIQSVANNLESIQQCLRIRGVDTDDIDLDEMRSSLLQFAELNETIEKIKKRRNKLLSKKRKIQSATDDDGSNQKMAANELIDKQHNELKESLLQARTSFYKVEKIVIPFLLKIPVPIREDMTDSAQVIDQFEGSDTVLKEHKQFPVINYIRLGYMNNVYHSSIVGPDAQYLVGDGAQAFHGLVQLLADHFEAAHYVPIGGLDITKSAVVEAVNDKEVAEDHFTIREKDCDVGQQHHLVGEASLEAFCAWLAKTTTDNPTGSRYLQLGSHYGRSFTQTHAVRCSILSDCEQSDQSMEQLYGQWWQALTTALGLRCQSLRVDVRSLRPGEHAKYQLQVWLHSKGEYVSVGEVTHYASYLSTRIGLTEHQRKHIISSAVDVLELLKCIFEHYQDPSTGKILYPQCLRDYFFI